MIYIKPNTGFGIQPSLELEMDLDFKSAFHESGKGIMCCSKKKKCCKKFKKGEHKRCGKCPKRV